MSKTKEILVQTRNAAITIKAYVYSGLAIHKDLDNPRYFTLTHLNTGRKIGFCSKKKDAIEKVNKLNDLYDWNKIKEIDDTKNIPNDILSKIRNILI
jgi:hypothetical protein